MGRLFSVLGDYSLLHLTRASLVGRSSLFSSNDFTWMNLLRFALFGVSPDSARVFIPTWKLRCCRLELSDNENSIAGRYLWPYARIAGRGNVGQFRFHAEEQQFVAVLSEKLRGKPVVQLSAVHYAVAVEFFVERHRAWYVRTESVVIYRAVRQYLYHRRSSGRDRPGENGVGRIKSHVAVDRGNSETETVPADVTLRTRTKPARIAGCQSTASSSITPMTALSVFRLIRGFWTLHYFSRTHRRSFAVHHHSLYNVKCRGKNIVHFFPSVQNA